jgi:hypothetical protein
VPVGAMPPADGAIGEDEDEEDEDDRAEVCDEDLQRQPQEREQSEHGADAGAKRLLP